MPMGENDDAYRDDHTAVGRGVVIGFVLGTVLWGIIIGAVVHLLKS
jgi:mannose/fructose/N-acetylgalactosamine-specific phosphotransferase system component IIC